SARTSLPRATASNATEAGSPPSGPRTVYAPTRSPQVCSWSAAAARKVSGGPGTPPGATGTRRGALLVLGGADGAVGVRADQLHEFLVQQAAELVGGAGAEHLHPGAEAVD